MKAKSLKEKAAAILFGKSHEKGTPFDSLGEYDRILGELQKDLTTWRLLALSLGAATFVAVGVAIWATRQPKTVPLLITMADWGEAKYIGRADNLSYQGIKVPDVAVQYQLRKFITNTFTLPADYDILKDNLRDCYSSLTSASASVFSAYLKADATNPMREWKDKVRRRVEVETILRLSSGSWQVDFVVSKMSESAELLEKKRMRAVCGIKLLEPAQNDLIKNPLGIYITNFDFSVIGDAK